MRVTDSAWPSKSSASRRGVSMPRARKSSVAQRRMDSLVHAGGWATAVTCRLVAQKNAAREEAATLGIARGEDDAFDFAANFSEPRGARRLEPHDEHGPRVRRAHETPRGIALGAERDARAVDVDDGRALRAEMREDGLHDVELDRIRAVDAELGRRERL